MSSTTSTPKLTTEARRRTSELRNVAPPAACACAPGAASTITAAVTAAHATALARPRAAGCSTHTSHRGLLAVDSVRILAQRSRRRDQGYVSTVGKPTLPNTRWRAWRSVWSGGGRSAPGHHVGTRCSPSRETSRPSRVRNTDTARPSLGSTPRRRSTHPWSRPIESADEAGVHGPASLSARSRTARPPSPLQSAEHLERLEGEAVLLHELCLDGALETCGRRGPASARCRDVRRRGAARARPWP